MHHWSELLRASDTNKAFTVLIFVKKSSTLMTLIITSLVEQNTPAVGHLEKRRSEEIVNGDCDLRN